MKIKTNVCAGMTFEECDAQRNWWKQQANMMESYANSTATYPPSGLWFPCQTQPYPPAPPPTPPTPTTCGGYVNGVCVPDVSGTCGY
ncbi:MAG: hypothetical protein H6Q37_95 [Chloroflexi bacterium]|jgi:hypothetical protein|nr:hypothetical protein [Chloroflexota bacterium]